MYNIKYLLAKKYKSNLTKITPLLHDLKKTFSSFTKITSFLFLNDYSKAYSTAHCQLIFKIKIKRIAQFAKNNHRGNVDLEVLILKYIFD